MCAQERTQYARRRWLCARDGVRESREPRAAARARTHISLARTLLFAGDDDDDEHTQLSSCDLAESRVVVDVDARRLIQSYGVALVCRKYTLRR